eukprot:789501-Rhodomonas_salina.3
MLAFTTLQDLQIDYAHTISIGHKNKQYYLIIVVDCMDFLWESPTKTKSGPEELLEEFLCYTRIKIGKLWCDFDSTMAKSENFCIRAIVRDIVICPTAGYQHTMQVLAEGVIGIVKVHVCSMLKHSGMPYAFRVWPWAVVDFC